MKIGGRTLFSGRPDEAAVTEDADGRRLKLIARSIGAVLLDNEALPQTYTTGLSLTELFDEHIRPYGFSTLITDFDVFFNQYQILKGTSEWEALSNFFRNGSQGIARIDDAGRVVCKMNPGEGSFHRISNRDAGAQRYTCLKITDNRYSPITRFVIRDDDGAYSYAYNNPEASALGLVAQAVPHSVGRVHADPHRRPDRRDAAHPPVQCSASGWSPSPAPDCSISRSATPRPCRADMRPLRGCWCTRCGTGSLPPGASTELMLVDRGYL